MGYRFSREYFAILALLSSQSALAEQPPTDNELRAAYCVGYVQVAISNIEAAQSALEKQTGEANKETRLSLLTGLKTEHQLSRQRLTRLNGYMLPKIPYLDSTALTIAMGQGQSDHGRWTSELTTCIRECPIRDNSDVEPCTKKCNGSELGQRVERCRNLSWLPF